MPSSVSPCTTNRRTSHDIQYTQPGASMDSYIYSFYPRMVKIWNILPSAVVHSPDPDIFKRNLMDQFTSGSMYCVPPRGTDQRPRLGSYSSAAAVGPVY